MTRSRAATALLLPLLFAIPAFAATSGTPIESFKDTCKAGYVYKISISADTGLAVNEDPAGDCKKQDGNGTFVNANTTACITKTADIEWSCTKNRITGKEVCEHHSCQEGKTIAAPELKKLVHPLPSQLSGGTFTTPTLQLPALTNQSIFLAIQQAPANTGQETVPSAQNTQPSAFESYLLNQSGLLSQDKTLVLTGGVSRDTALLSPELTQTNQESSNTFSPTTVTPQEAVKEASTFSSPEGTTFAPVPTQRTFSQWASDTWRDLWNGKLTSNEANAAPQTQTPPNVTVLNVTPTTGNEGQPAPVVQNTPPQQGAPTVVPDNTQQGSAQPSIRYESLPSIQVLDSQGRAITSDQGLRQLIGSNAPVQPTAGTNAPTQPTEDVPLPQPKPPQLTATPLRTPQPGIVWGLSEWYRTGDNTIAKNAWESMMRAVPTQPVETANLPPIPGTEPTVAAAQPPQGAASPASEPAVAPIGGNAGEVAPIVPSTPAAQGQLSSAPTDVELQKIGTVFEERLAAAKQTLAFTKDLFGTPSPNDFLQNPAVATAQQRLNDIQAKYDQYVTYMNQGGEAPAWLQQAVDTARKGEALTSNQLSTFSSRASDAADAAGKDFMAAYQSGSAGGMLTGGFSYLGLTGLSMFERGVQTGGEMLGLPGFNPTETRAYEQAIDPIGKATGAIVDTSVFAGPVTGATTRTEKIFGPFFESTVRGPTNFVRDFEAVMAPGVSVPAQVVTRGVGETVAVTAEGGIAAGVRTAESAAREAGGAVTAPVEAPVSAGARTMTDVAQELRAITGESGASAPASTGRLPPAPTLEMPGTTPSPASNPYAALDRVVAETRVAAEGEGSAGVQAAAEVRSAAPQVVEGGGRAVAKDVVAEERTAQEVVDKTTLKGWTGGAVATAGILCLGFCPLDTPASPPQEKPLTVELAPEPSQKVAEQKIPEPAAAPQPAPPAAIPQPPAAPTPPQVAENPTTGAPQPAVTPTSPPEQQQPPAAQPKVENPPPVLSSPLSNTETPSAVPNDVVTNEELRQRAKEEADRVQAEIDKRKQADQQAQQQEQEQRDKQVSDLYDQAERMRQQNQRMQNPPQQIPQPVITPSASPVPGAGPSPEEIAQGLGGSATGSGAGTGNGSGTGSNQVSIPIQFVNDTANPTLEGSKTIGNLGEAASRERFKGYTFVIEGYTDPRTPSARWNYDNVQLSQARAEAVRQTIATMYNISLQDIVAIGRGAVDPIRDVSGAINYDASRRVVVTAIPPRR